MPELKHKPSPPDEIEATAAQWLARRDRGLDPREQADLAAWQRADPRHAAALGRLEMVWQSLDRLADRRPALAADPAQGLSDQRRRRARWYWIPVLAATAAGFIVYLSGPRLAEAPARPHAILHPGPEWLALEDGSTVKLNTGAKVDVQFTPAERRVRLVRGEAFFTVAKNPARPFIVAAGQITVRAVGTAFNVGLDPREISVLVTEGRVRVNEIPPPAGTQSAPPRGLAELGAGQQGVVALPSGPDAATALEMKVAGLSPEQIERALAWQGPRLEFVALPLGDVVADFNRYNRRQLVIHDAATAAILVGGNFRADNLDAFLRLLKAGFGVSAFPQGGEIILRRTHVP